MRTTNVQVRKIKYKRVTLTCGAVKKVHKNESTK